MRQADAAEHALSGEEWFDLNEIEHLFPADASITHEDFRVGEHRVRKYVWIALVHRDADSV